jgi:hypothetical protein
MWPMFNVANETNVANGFQPPTLTLLQLFPNPSPTLPQPFPNSKTIPIAPLPAVAENFSCGTE